MSALEMTLLPVPYYVQPENNWCQSTCLQMVRDYLRSSVTRDPIERYQLIHAINRELNEPLPADPGGERPRRPSHVRNAWSNFQWWIKWRLRQNWVFKDNLDPKAVGVVLDSIKRGMPVIAGVLHPRTTGHVILVIGCEEPVVPGTRGTYFYCHDPYGDALRIEAWGGRSWHGAGAVPRGRRWTASDRRVQTGFQDIDGDRGPGMAVRYDVDGIARQFDGGLSLRLLYEPRLLRPAALDVSGD